MPPLVGVIQIARRFKRKRDTIERWLDPDRKEGEDHQRSGRPRSTTPQEDKKVVNQYRGCWRKKSMGRRAIGQELKNPESKMPKISGDTAYRRLQEAGGEMKVKQKYMVFPKDYQICLYLTWIIVYSKHQQKIKIKNNLK